MEGARNNTTHDNQSGYIFDLMEKFAEYGFNKSHSAAYALGRLPNGLVKSALSSGVYGSGFIGGYG